MERYLLKMKNVSNINLTDWIKQNNVNKIIRVWSVIEPTEYDIQNYKTIELKHNKNVFLEEKTHDWLITSDNLFRIYSRVHEANKELYLIIIYNESRG